MSVSFALMIILGSLSGAAVAWLFSTVTLRGVYLAFYLLSGCYFVIGVFNTLFIGEAVNKDWTTAVFAITATSLFGIASMMRAHVKLQRRPSRR